MWSPIFKGSVWKAGMEPTGSEKPGNWLQQFIFQYLCSFFFDPESLECEAQQGGHLTPLRHPLTLMNLSLDLWPTSKWCHGALLTAFISPSMGNVPVGSRFCATDPLQRMGSWPRPWPEHQATPPPGPAPGAPGRWKPWDSSDQSPECSRLSFRLDLRFSPEKWKTMNLTPKYCGILRMFPESNSGTFGLSNWSVEVV